MALVGVSITKQVAFRESSQEFGNTYHYTWTGLNPSSTLANSLIDAIVALEKTYHSTLVSFTYARCWSAGGSISSNAMITEKALSGTGTAATTASFDKERAWLCQWPAGVDSRGKQVYLRKWYHTCGSFHGNQASAANLTNDTSLSSTIRSNIAADLVNIGNIAFGSGLAGTLCSPDGSRTKTDAGFVHRFLEHRQLGDQWR